MRYMIIILFVKLVFAQNYIFVHGLNSNANTFYKIAKEVAIDKNISTIVKIGIQHIANDTLVYNKDDELIHSSQISSDNTLAKIYGLTPDGVDNYIFYYKTININDNNLSMENALKVESNTTFNTSLFIINLSNNIDLSFEEQGKELSVLINKISTIRNDNNFVLIGHSMGGLAIRSYIQYFKDTNTNINTVITIATPHNGITVDSSSIFGASGKNLLSTSDDIVNLNTQNIDVYNNIPFISFLIRGYDKSILSGDIISGVDDDGVVPFSSQKPIFKTYTEIFSPNCDGFDNCIKLSSELYHTDELSNDVIAKEIKKFLSVIHLHIGWNLISASLKQFNLKNTDIAWKYNTKWYAYSKKHEASLQSHNIPIFNENNVTNGLWIYSNKEQDFNYIRDNSQNLTFTSGWNLAGTSVDIIPQEINCDDKYTYIWTYQNNTWKFYSNEINTTKIPLITKINKNEGFWVKCK